MIGRRDALPCLALAACLAAVLAPVLFTGNAFFLHDLTNISHPWRALAAEQLQRGQVPLWNPYAYFGLPLLGNFQSGVLYPPSLLFHLFKFPAALGVFLAAVHALAGGGAYLLLRRMRLAPWPAAGGAAVFCLGGYMVSHDQFPNLLGALALMPALLLFCGSPALLGLASAWSLAAGYPPVWAGVCLAALAGRFIWASPRRGAAAAALGMGRAAAGLGLGAVLAAAVLLPGLELAGRSSRGVGIELEERVNFSLEPYELSTLAHPAVARWWSRRSQSPRPQRNEISWTYEGVTSTFAFTTEYVDPLDDPAGIKVTPWKSGYAGGLASLLALAGLAWLAWRRPRAAALAAAWLAAVAFLLLGNNLEASRWVWLHAPGLGFIRGPARLSYLALAVAMPLAAAGLQGVWRLGRRGRVAAAALSLAVAAELAWLGRGFYPTIPADYFSERGPIVENLAGGLGSLRYFQYPALEQWPFVNQDDPSPAYRKFKDVVFRTYKQKLFGISNAPFHLAAGSGGYEPLVPRAADRLIAAFQDRGLAARLMPWAGVRYLLDRRLIRAPGGAQARSPAPRLEQAVRPGEEVPGLPLRYAGLWLWHAYEAEGESSLGRWVPAADKDKLGRGLADFPPGLAGSPWAASRPREDRLELKGNATSAGVLHVAQLRYPGWLAYVNGRRADMEPSLDAFTRVDVPAGDVKVALLYRPLSWRLGLLATLASLGLLALAGWRRLDGIFWTEGHRPDDGLADFSPAGR